MAKKTGSVKSSKETKSETISGASTITSGANASKPKKSSKAGKKFDFKTEFMELYGAREEPSIVEVNEAKYFMVDGKGDPNSPGALDEVMTLLYGASYTLKMKILKNNAPEKDYVVPPSEGLWWIEGMVGWSMERDKWSYTIMLRIPDYVTDDEIKQALELFKKTKNPPRFDRLYVKSYKEGLCVQILHLGPYVDESKSNEKMRNYACEKGYDFSGKHHEIYLSDPRKIEPAKLKTIIREPIAKKQ